MKTRLLLVAALSITTLLAMTTPAAASTPADVTIVSDMVVNPEGSTGTFVASGPAVDAGLLCSAGTVQDTEAAAYGWQSGQIIILYVHKYFVCDDGSGAFEMDLRVRLSPDGTTTARWVITGADGSYAGLLGTGGLTGAPLDGAIQDTYTGQLHIE